MFGAATELETALPDEATEAPAPDRLSETREGTLGVGRSWAARAGAGGWGSETLGWRVSGITPGRPGAGVCTLGWRPDGRVTDILEALLAIDGWADGAPALAGMTNSPKSSSSITGGTDAAGLVAGAGGLGGGMTPPAVAPCGVCAVLMAVPSLAGRAERSSCGPA